MLCKVTEHCQVPTIQAFLNFIAKIYEISRLKKKTNVRKVLENALENIKIADIF